MAKLSGLEDSVLRDGMKGARLAIDVITSHSKKLNADHKLKEIVRQLESLYGKLNPGFVGKATSLDSYSSQLKRWVRSDSFNLKELESSLSRTVLSAKRADTKSNRIATNHKILSFWSSNKDQIPLLIQFRNLVLSAKAIIES